METVSNHVDSYGGLKCVNEVCSTQLMSCKVYLGREAMHKAKRKKKHNQKLHLGVFESCLFCFGAALDPLLGQ